MVFSATFAKVPESGEKGLKSAGLGIECGGRIHFVTSTRSGMNLSANSRALASTRAE